MPVRQARNAVPARAAIAPSARLARRCSARAADEQSQHPDRAAMRVAAAGRGEHVRLGTGARCAPRRFAQADVGRRVERPRSAMRLESCRAAPAPSAAAVESRGRGARRCRADRRAPGFGVSIASAISACTARSASAADARRRRQWQACGAPSCALPAPKTRRRPYSPPDQVTRSSMLRAASSDAARLRAPHAEVLGVGDDAARAAAAAARPRIGSPADRASRPRWRRARRGAPRRPAPCRGRRCPLRSRRGSHRRRRS